MKAPSFWRKTGLLPALLTPASWLYRAGASLRAAAASPYRAPVPVICVGNLVAGGAGKTPVALSLGRAFTKRGLKVAFLSRGYGGNLAGPLQVQPDRHSASDVGDEPLLLAEVAPTWISRNRAAGAEMAAAAGADIILMDDGFQNPTSVKSASVLVIDGAYGFGNGHVIPAGPLRESVAGGLARADAAILLGEDRHELAPALARTLPVLRGRLTPARNALGLRGERAIAFAGIGRPEKFFETLEELGVSLLETRAFGDHAPYRGEDLIDLIGRAEREDALLLTTAKDHVRLPEELRLMVRRVDVDLVWENAAALEDLLDRLIHP
ncbi:tetraacyldisaccharide 4'-kinase [Nisaea acidiphila]|uniref:Tetraacyldisaccharide 4'-kinase n=1 Tax=Nisaea acidiphila TaxID=1862145 RepID=A0A9J7ASE0_9PROT|nr:tetraacyldisaccharide 4'-kinase [Nisaea acidiphila]UUX48237.1 tetraacyldisaccharide 4'-kinase [Nisaea acidiphila]